jgi:putative tricarboxylic transport membrane protein
VRIGRDRLSGLFFLALCIAYGVEAQTIQVFWADPNDPLTPRTFPTALAWVGGLIAFLMVIAPENPQPSQPWPQLKRFDWLRVAALLGFMVLYGLTLQRIGFLLASTGFLVAGFVLLGERRWWMIAAASLPVVAFFQFALHGILGIYIADPFLARLGVIR